MRAWPILAGALLAACNSQSQEQKEASDARAIAAVEAAQKRRPPVAPITPQPIAQSEVVKFSLYGPGCAFSPDGTSLLLLTEPKRAAFKPKDEVVILASDPGSAQLPGGTWSHYVGKQYALTITRKAGEGRDAAWPGKLVVTDPADQVVYEADVQARCF